MIDVNLLPWRDELRKLRKRRLCLIIVFATVFAILIVFFWRWSIGTLRVDQQHRNALVTKEINQLVSANNNLRGIKQERNQFIGKIKTIEALHNNRFQAVRFFNELMKVLPGGVYLTKLLREGDKTILTGYTASNAHITQLMRNVTDSNYFVNPSLQYITNNTNRYGISARRFQLQMTIKSG